MDAVKYTTITGLREHMSRILGEVSEGGVYAITLHGKLVAYLVSPDSVDDPGRAEANQQYSEDKAARNKADTLASGAEYEVGGEG